MSKPEVRAVDRSNVHFSTVRNNNLAPDVQVRLRKVYDTLRQNPTVAKASVMDKPFADVERNFSRDLHPEREVLVWEIMAQRIIAWLKRNPYTSNRAIEDQWFNIMFQVSVEHPITVQRIVLETA